MFVFPHPRLELEGCGRCKGLWFDRRELASYLGHSRPGRAIDNHSPADEETTPTVCPRCETTALVLCHRQGIAFLKCPDCEGMFVPAKALERICDRHGASPARSAGVLAGEGLVHVVLGLIGGAR